MPTQRVLVTVMERHFDATVTAMRAAGMTNIRQYEELGVVAGEIVDPDALVGIPGVMGVESARPMPAPRTVRRSDGGR
ncbi:hypothetical protein [Mycobacteroides abscessus]|uniref:Uncharacterized protein n=2 Tax=Mycobacteroides abscessus TaxID=36809 RepID=A0AB38CUG1_9MYCO|nr:hypothetical protein [Mycobacteroides abscessus]AKP59761.1 hypothetical protein MAUC22_20980 [Mycobacteroides abscessus UC22]AMU67211.1 hypothetical protein A3O04_19445 [Mycobacteroides abscessus]ANO15748.1 hypothetical protein BAB77_19245 [Mycobacteroides abscessus]ARQ66058.1 hypothetical protein CAK77_19515 [Mycobacteroides abscessus subsp. massiliense]AWG49689.1 hypothetical protein DDT48_09985 [Mycobacteroides abscessus]